MKSLKTIRKAPFIGIFLVSFSCTIIQDSDITSSDQLSKLKLKGIEIKQETSKGNNTVAATLVYDSALNIVDPSTGAKIIRRVWFSLAPFGSLKMKLRSGTTTKTDFYISYKEGNQPYTVVFLKGDSIVELYRFRYNSTSSTARLNKIITVLNPVDGLPATVRTNDTIIYDTSNKLTTITRRSADATKTGTITLEYLSSPSTGLSKITWNPTSSTVDNTYQQRQNCPNGTTSSACGGFQAGVAGSGPQINYQFYSSSNLLNQVLIEDHRIDLNGGTNCYGCSLEYGTFYFHPLMILKDQFALGNDVLLIYMIDWWIPGALLPVGGANTNQPQKNEYVIFNFIYGQ